MRIYLKTSPNTEPVPFNYQVALVGALHKWLGQNEHHDVISLYSLSWFTGGKSMKKHLDFPSGGVFFISSPDDEFIKQIMQGIVTDPEIRFGMKVKEVMLQQTPEFGEKETFYLQSPVLIKRKLADQQTKFYLARDPEANTLLTETIQHKLKVVGRDDLKLQIAFDPDYPKVKTKLVDYKGTLNKATYCPVTIEGDPEAIAFAWEVGIGNSTGIGFGALK